MSSHQTVIGVGCLTVTCVKEVEGFSDRELKLTVLYREKEEKRLSIFGTGLKIVGFSNQTGDLSLIGTVDAVRYHAKGDRVIKRLFR